MVFILTYHNFSIQSKDLSHEFAYMDKDLSHRYMTSGSWILTVGTYLHNECKDRDYFLHLKKIETNLQNGPKVKDQNAYLLLNLKKVIAREEPINSNQMLKLTLKFFILINNLF